VTTVSPPSRAIEKVQVRSNQFDVDVLFAATEE